MHNKDLEKLIEQVVSNVMSQETPLERKKRLRDQFKAQPADPHNVDINTPQGRANVLNKLKTAYGNVITRAQILDKKGAGALRAETKEEFMMTVGEMFDNISSLMNKDFINLVKTYQSVAKQLGLQPVVMEATTTIDTPDGRRNVIRNVVNSIGKLRKATDDGNKMINTAEATSNVSMFVNEIKALGNKLRDIKAEITILDRYFDQTFPDAYRKYKSQSVTKGIT